MSPHVCCLEPKYIRIASYCEPTFKLDPCIPIRLELWRTTSTRVLQCNGNAKQLSIPYIHGIFLASCFQWFVCLHRQEVSFCVWLNLYGQAYTSPSPFFLFFSFLSSFLSNPLPTFWSLCNAILISSRTVLGGRQYLSRLFLLTLDKDGTPWYIRLNMLILFIPLLSASYVPRVWMRFISDDDHISGFLAYNLSSCCSQ